jgi:hypothetical protein
MPLRFLNKEFNEMTVSVVNNNKLLNNSKTPFQKYI